MIMVLKYGWYLKANNDNHKIASSTLTMYIMIL